MANERSCVQLIDEKGEFNITEFEQFGERVGMNNWGDSYTVVSIMDPHSGGKSKLLSHLFNSEFRVMDASEERNQTTHGVWVANSGNKPCTLVMDMEESDSRNRGENGTEFGIWSTLFALAISDIVLINMSGHDIGRENAASKPLLKTVLKFMRCTPRKVTLMFVLRDQTGAALEKLRANIWKDMKKIWNSTGSSRKLEEFFDFDGQLKVEALCSREENEFKNQVAELKNKICGVDRDQRNVVPASDFSENAKRIWEKIKDIKDLRIPSIKVLVAKFHCDRIANEKFQCFKRDYKAEPLSSLLETCLSEYKNETRHWDEAVRSEMREELKKKLQQLLQEVVEAKFNRTRLR